MLNLSSDQRGQVVGAAATLTPAARPAFIGDVETTLAQHCMGKVPSNTDVQRAINCVLDAVAWPRSNNSVFMCDSIPEQEATMQDDDNFETKIIDGREVRVLRDGGRLHVGTMMMDGADEILRSTVDDMQGKPKRGYTTADAEKFGLKDGGQLHRPGFRFAPDAYAKDETLIAYADRDAADAEAWKGNPPTGQGSQGFVEKTGDGKAGDSCTLNGNRGTLQYVDGELVCVPDHVHERYKGKNGATMQRDHAQRMSEIYAAHDRALEAAWKGGKT
jgi:hypothetical protein